MRNNNKPIQGYVPCQHCGKPAPVYLPKGGPRKDTQYYVCSEHSNQQGSGVHEYCLEHTMPDLDSFAEKYDSLEECQALRSELENAGILETVISTGETNDDVVLDTDEPEENLLIDNDTSQPIKPVENEQEENEPNQSGGGFVLLLLLGFLLVSGAGYMLYRKLKKGKPSVNGQPEEKQPQQPQPSKVETDTERGILL
ncbi:hypothetical protein [Vibrio sp. HN007]|uniref:hypothetical protein n=1 Tax=Vibrio iocasae TaxID=3098914 RepID=UPI0035D4E257